MGQDTRAETAHQIASSVPESAKLIAHGRIHVTILSEGRREKILAVEDLTIERGKVTAILGATGSGKTTLLNVLGGLERADPGSAVVMRLHADDPRTTSLDSSRVSRTVSYAFQQGHLLLNASVGLNLSIAARGYASRRDKLEALRRAGLGDQLVKPDDPRADRKFLARRAHTLSGGQQQRLNLARAMIRKPTIIFADEPTSSLDARTGRMILDALKEWVREDKDHNRTVLLVTHDRELALFSDNIIVLGGPGPTVGTVIHGGATARTPRSRGELDRLLDGSETPQVVGECADTKRGEPAACSTDATAPGNDHDRAKPSPPPWAVVRVARMFGQSSILAMQELFRSKDRPSALGILRRFQRWSSFAVFTLVAILLVGLFYTERFADDFFTTAIADPRLRQVVIASNPLLQQETLLTPDKISDLNDTSAGAYHIPSRGVYPRKDLLENFRVFLPDSDAPLGRYQAQLLAIERQEPVLAQTALLTLAGQRSGRTVAQAMAEFDDDAGGTALVLDRRYFATIAAQLRDSGHQISPEMLAGGFRLYMGPRGDRRIIVLGLFEQSVPDRGYVYDGLMSMDSYVELLAKARPGQLAPVTPRRPSTYPRAAVYFDAGIYRETQETLNATPFAFSRDNFNKIVELIGIAGKFAVILKLLILAVSIVASVFIVLEIWTLLNRMWKGALILFAQGVGRSVFFSAVLQQFVLVFSAAVGLIGGVAYLASWSCDGILRQLQANGLAAGTSPSGEASNCNAALLRSALVDAAPFAVGGLALALVFLILLVYLSSRRRDTFARQLGRH